LVIVCDDLITRGDTLGEIARAIQVNHPRIELLGVGAGKSERAAWAANFNKQLSNGHLTAQQAQEWDSAR
jgi:hypothetical protein